MHSPLGIPGSCGFTRGPVSIQARFARFEMMTAGVVVRLFWELEKKMAVLVLDEAHIRRAAYTDVFQMAADYLLPKGLFFVE